MCDSRTCYVCKQEKALELFGKSKKDTAGYGWQCKECKRAEWHAKGKDLPSAKKPRNRTQTNAERYAQYQATLAARIGPPLPPRPRPPEKLDPSVSKWHSRSERDKAHQQFLTTMRSRRCRQATPAYADRAAMEDMYLTARQLSALSGTKFHVDHIIPLTNPYVCGLNVETNMRVIPAHENHVKKNKFEPIEERIAA